MASGSEKPTEAEWFASLFERLAASNFRSRFHLRAKEKVYANEKGIQTIESHARDFVRNRLSAENPVNDGKQTPMRGHPVFARSVSQTTATLASAGTWRAARQRAKRVGGAARDGDMLPGLYCEVAQDSCRTSIDGETAELSG